MTSVGHRLQFTPIRSPRGTAWIPQLVRVLALIGLLMLPVDMRAGTEHPHPHALFQLLLDASDGKIDHHALEDADRAAHSDVHEDASGQQPDPPIYSDMMDVSGSLAVLAMITVLLAIPAAVVTQIWPQLADWRGRIPMLEPPPPRCVAP